MTTLLTIIHALICLSLVVIVLMQSGRGGGLTEGFSSVESAFGAKTNEFLIKGTTIVAALFLVTSLSLAFLSSKKDKSLMAEAAKAAEKAAKTNPLEDMDLPVIDLTVPAGDEDAVIDSVENATQASEKDVADTVQEVEQGVSQTMPQTTQEETEQKIPSVPAFPTLE